MSLSEAVLELRTKLKLTQQAFATDLGLSISTIQKYEKGRRPDAKSLRLLTVVAERAGQQELADIFRSEFLEEIGASDFRDVGLPFWTREEHEWTAALLTCLRVPAFRDKVAAVKSALQESWEYARRSSSGIAMVLASARMSAMGKGDEHSKGKLERFSAQETDTEVALFNLSHRYQHPLYHTDSLEEVLKRVSALSADEKKTATELVFAVVRLKLLGKSDQQVSEEIGLPIADVRLITYEPLGLANHLFAAEQGRRSR